MQQLSLSEKHWLYFDKITSIRLSVPEILRDMGGQVGSQAVLKKQIMEELSCSDKSAKKYIKNAVDKTIVEHDLGGKSLGYEILESG